MERNRLQSIFCPTEEELQERYDRINELIRTDLQIYGECCSICKHSLYVQESPYYDYITCEFDSSIEFGFGEGAKNHQCDKFEFMGYFKAKKGEEK